LPEQEKRTRGVSMPLFASPWRWLETGG